MSKGSSPAGTTTSTTTNPAAQAQLPYLQDIFQGAEIAYRNNPQNYYPGQTLSDFVPTNPVLGRGYESLDTAGQTLAGTLQPVANSAFTNLAGANYQQSPAYGGYNAYATGAAPAQQNLAGIPGAALTASQQYPAAISGYAPQAAAYGAQAAGPNVGTSALARAAQGQGAGLNALMSSNPGLDQLTKAASGAYLNSNPYIDAMYRAASAPVTQNYQTATAPTTDALFSGGGRYGSGAYAGGVSTNEQNLGKSLGDLSANIYGTQYARERAAQDTAATGLAQLTQSGAKAYQDAIQQAATNYGTLSNQGNQLGITGATAAGNLQNAAANQAYSGMDSATKAAAAQAVLQQYGITGLQGAYSTGNTNQLNALNAYPQLAQANLFGPNAAITAGKGLTDIDQTYRTYQQAQIDDAVKRYNANQAQPWTNLGLYEQAIGGALGNNSSTTSPYFQNPVADALGAASGSLGIGKSLFGAGGLFGGLGGLGGAALDIGGVAQTAAGLGAATGLDAATLADIGLIAAPAATWIICTELLRQGKLSKLHYAAGLRVWQAYPERIKSGYYIWAIPTVRHLRRRPNSLFSRVVGAAARWRAETLAAQAGARGGRKSWRGSAVSAAFDATCWLLGSVVPQRDWRVVYQADETA